MTHPFPPDPPRAPAPGSGAFDPDTERAREQTGTGLLLLLVGSAIGWIPYISFIGGLLVIIALGYLFFGRHGFGAAHHRNVLLGGALVILGALVALVITLSFVSTAVHTAAGQPTNSSVVASGLQGELTGLLLGLAVAGILQLVGQVVVVFDLADPTTRGVLILGIGIGTVIALVTIELELPILRDAIAQALAGPKVNTAPLDALQNQANVFGALRAAPSLVLAYAYYRIRGRLTSLDSTH